MAHKIPSHQKKEGVGMQKLTLRVLFFEHQGIYRGVCLETYTVVEARTFEKALTKMQDALSIYLDAFSLEEILDGKFYRIAPLKYRIKSWSYLFLKSLSKLRKEEIDYDPQTKNLRFA